MGGLVGCLRVDSPMGAIEVARHSKLSRHRSAQAEKRMQRYINAAMPMGHYNKYDNNMENNTVQKISPRNANTESHQNKSFGDRPMYYIFVVHSSRSICPI